MIVKKGEKTRSDQGRNWRFLKGGGAMETTEAGGLGGRGPPEIFLK